MSKWKLVPVEPSEAMVSAGNSYNNGWNFGYCWKKALAASPDPAEDAELIFQIVQVLPHDPVYCAYTHGDGAFGCSCHTTNDARAVLRLLSTEREGK